MVILLIEPTWSQPFIRMDVDDDDELAHQT